jgi:hypothetical protein
MAKNGNRPWRGAAAQSVGTRAAENIRFAPRASAAHVHYPRDEQVPLVDGDREMECGWRCSPVPPTNDGGWVIFDDTKDYKTGWICADLLWGNA